MLVAVMILHLGCYDIDSPPVESKRDPNILLIMADDMGYGDITSHGNPHIKTPRLDALKKSSVVFQHFYVSPVCAPTRASLLTGKYHQRVGVQSVTNGHEVLDASAVTMAEWLEERGYRNGIFGKWHLGEYEPSLPLSQGFHEFLGFRTGHTPEYFDAILEKNGQNHQTTGYITRVLTEAAWTFMRQSERPFFCYLPYNVPHTPLQVDTILIQPHLRKGLSDRTSRIYAMIEHLDHDVGMLLDSMRQKQMLSNTIVIFMSDNGPISGWKVPQTNMRYNAGLRDQKFTIYDGGIRSPSYWMWEGKWPAHPVKDQVAAHIDVLPTLLDVIGMQSVDPSLDGISLRRHLQKANVPSDKRLFFQKYALGTFGDLAPQPGGMVRQGHWKMVNGNELYKLDVDIGEKFNLAKIESAKLDSLNRAYNNWWKSIIAECDLSVRPIAVGLELNATTDLQPHHGKVLGDLEYTGHRGLLGERTGTHPQGVDGDWLANWQENGDAITWHLVATYDGPYELSLRYRSSFQKSPVKLALMADDQMMSSFSLLEAQKDWYLQSLDTIQLEAGVINLKLVLEKDVDPGFELRSLSLRRLKE